MSTPAGGRVCAVVVAYNRAGLLRECLAALGAQTRAVDTILVVDNASTDGTRGLVRAEFPGATVLGMAANGGGAGGFHAGMRWAYKEGYEWLWLMDDDARPAADCLGRLLAHARPNAVLVPVQQDNNGWFYGITEWKHREIEVTTDLIERGEPVSGKFVFRFVGPLIAREVVAQVGLPNKDFFIWFDDTEYALRIQSSSTVESVVVPDALIYHHFGGELREVSFLGRRGTHTSHSAWKEYYGARNYLYTIIWVRRQPQEVFRFCLRQTRYSIRDIIYEPDRWLRVRMRLLGMLDGAIGRLGKRI